MMQVQSYRHSRVRALVRLFLFLLNSVGSFAFLSPLLFKRTIKNPIELSGSVAESFEGVSREFSDQNVAEIQKILVQKGVEFKDEQEAGCSDLELQQRKTDLGSLFYLFSDDTVASSQESLLSSPMDKVPGCVANVYVQTSLRKRPSTSGWDASFGGTADALLSRGLLAVLTTALTSTSVQDILQIDPYFVADQLGIRRALSPGRNDGLANMLQIIQQQINVLLKDKDEPRVCDPTNSTNVAPLFLDKTNADASRREPSGHGKTSPLKLSRDKPSKKMPTVALLLSGGVDSSVALRLLLQEGYDVTAFYLKIWLEDELSHLGQCPWEDDYIVCRQVCEQAGVPLESLSLQDEYRDRVISYTIHEAQRGRTPNPDILCNSRVKFGCFSDILQSRDFDFVASGHYARLEPSLADRINARSDSAPKPVHLFRAPDPIKDQSYFLCALTQEQLKRVIFPIGHLEKAQVRQLAEQFQLPNRNRPDSQGLCFLGKVKFEEFLGAYLGEHPGDIMDARTGDILGRHRGVWYHTVGQRKGIGKVLNPQATSRGPWYVVAKDPDQGLVYCSNQYDEEIFAAARSEFHVEDIQWIAGIPPNEMKNGGSSARFNMKIRHGPKIVGGVLTLSTSEGSAGSVKLDHKDGGLAPGQYVVFYNGEECLGGGVISERHWAKFLTQHHEAFQMPL